jgi:hypothetical protein
VICSQRPLFLVAIVPSQAISVVVICRNSHSGYFASLSFRLPIPNGVLEHTNKSYSFCVIKEHLLS